MKPDLPQVIEFNHAYDVKLETHDGRTRVVARIKPSKYDTGYKRFHDLPFVGLDASNNHYRPWHIQKSENITESQERGRYFWNEYVRYVRGHQRKRRQDAISSTRWLLAGMFGFESLGSREIGTFFDHLIEGLVSHLRVGLDEGKTDQQLKAEEVAA